MGTRHIIRAVVDGELKISQYGQWDGYITGQGKDIAAYLSYYENGKEQALVDAIRNCHWLTDAEIKEVEDYGFGWTSNWPWLSGDAGSTVFEHVFNNNGLGLMNEQDTGWIKYIYTLDFDKENITVHHVYTDQSFTYTFREWIDKVLIDEEGDEIEKLFYPEED